jgi:hypothetical protein
VQQHVTVKHDYPLLFGCVVLEVVDHCPGLVVGCVPVFELLIPGKLQKEQCAGTYA